MLIGIEHPTEKREKRFRDISAMFLGEVMTTLPTHPELIMDYTIVGHVDVVQNFDDGETKSEDVAFGSDIGLVGEGAFWRKISRVTDFFLIGLCTEKTKVSDFEHVAPIGGNRNQNIGWFNITVYHTSLVNAVQSSSNISDEGPDTIFRQEIRALDVRGQPTIERDCTKFQDLKPSVFIFLPKVNEGQQIGMGR